MRFKCKVQYRLQKRLESLLEIACSVPMHWISESLFLFEFNEFNNISDQAGCPNPDISIVLTCYNFSKLRSRASTLKHHVPIGTKNLGIRQFLNIAAKGYTICTTL